MDVDYEKALNGSLQEAQVAKADISNVFQCLESAKDLKGRRHQLIFANAILRAIYHCNGIHTDVYIEIITEVFATNLDPNVDAKLWTAYLDSIRFYYYNLMCKKNYQATAAIFRTIDAYQNKIQNENAASIVLNTYSYHLFLQKSQLKHNAEQGQEEAIRVIDALIRIFNEILDRNLSLNMQFNNLLHLCINWLLPNSSLAKCSHFYSTLPKLKVKSLFSALFNSNCFQQPTNASTSDVKKYTQIVISELNNLLQFDVINKLQLRLCLDLVQACTQDNRFKRILFVSKFFRILHRYLDCLCVAPTEPHFSQNLVRVIDEFLEYFKQHSNNLASEVWFSDALIFLCLLHSNVLNTSVFDGFWSQISHPFSYKSICDLLAAILKLCPAIRNDSKLIALDCCTSSRKHIVVMLTQTALGVYMLYCRNANEETELGSAQKHSKVQEAVDAVSESVTAILNYGFNLIEKMDCITETSQDMNVLTTRFKQITLNAKTAKQAMSCITICCLYKKLKSKISHSEWSALLRRLYKSVAQANIENMELAKELQSCYIASLLDHSTILEIPFIRLQINIYYVRNSEQNEQVNNKCLSQQYEESKHPLKVSLTAARKNLLFYLDSQDLMKYDKSNNILMESLLAAAPTKYAYVTALRMTKLLPGNVTCLQTMCKTIRTNASKEEGTQNRLDQLIYAHACSLLLQHEQELIKHKCQINSEDIMEDNMEKLFARQELSTLSLQNELQQVKHAMEAFKGFEKFFEMFDKEFISSDVAIIYWEYIIDDLSSLAQYFQFAGYLNNCFNVWYLHYKITRLLQDDNSSMRSLTFFCEHYDVIDQKLFSKQSINEEINMHFPTILADLNNLTSLSKQAQAYLLIAIAQIAYYYASSSRYVFAQMLLQFVEQTRDSLPDRHGKYDVIKATIDAIKFRLLWRHCGNQSNTAERSEAESRLLHQYIFRRIDENMESFRNFSYICSKDSFLYMILLMDLTYEVAECSANRLYGNFLNAFFVAVSKIAFKSGLALRFIQVMIAWMGINLQEELIDKAQTKLKFIELVLGVRSLKELQVESDCKAASDNSTEVALSLVKPVIESVRKITQIELSPIKTDTLMLAPNLKEPNLLDYLKYNVETKFLPECEIVEWTYFTVGCLIARMYFLVEHHQQLDEFYECCSWWLNTRRSKFYMKYFKNVQLMYLQHYANYLRSRQKYDKAIKCLEYAIEYNAKIPANVDLVYNINFHLQLHSAYAELARQKNEPIQKSNIKYCHQLDEEEYMKVNKSMREKMSAWITKTKKADEEQSNSNMFLTPKLNSLQHPQVISSACGKLESYQNSTENKSLKISKLKLKWELCEEMKNAKKMATPLVNKTPNHPAGKNNTHEITEDANINDVLNENMAKLDLNELAEMIDENPSNGSEKPQRHEQRTASVRKLKAPIVILNDDSPNIANPTSAAKVQNSRTAAKKRNETPYKANDKTQSSRSPILTRSQRKAAKGNNCKNAENATVRNLPNFATPTTSRRPPKI